MQLNLVKEPGRLLRRYKRFLADIELADGSLLTLYCPNTGSMKGCAEPGSLVYYSDSGNDKRKYRYTWELARTTDGHWICINTALPNKIVGEALLAGKIPELAGYTEQRAEVNYGRSSRIDWLLQGHGQAQDCYVEVKNLTLLEDGQGFFPDAVSTRAKKHLNELVAMQAAGFRAVIFYLVSHSGISHVLPADHIDPGYADAYWHALDQGVEVLAYQAMISDTEITLGEPVEVAGRLGKGLVSGQSKNYR